ncbi:hypothetical protein [Streptomyces sp. NPDC004050]
MDVTPPGERKKFDSDHPNGNEEITDRYGLTLVRGSVTQVPFPDVLKRAQAARPVM